MLLLLLFIQFVKMTGWHQKAWPVLGCFPQHTLQKTQYNDETQYDN